MKDFFTFYKDINEMQNPFLAFSFYHLLCIGMITLLIMVCFRKYNQRNEKKKDQYLRYMAIYFIVEELIYTSWLLLTCHEQVWIQIIPLELCSLCAYMNAFAVFSKKEYLRFFGAVVGLVAGAVAILYPANISGLYPMLSYRVLNFYILHGSFILFALIQLKDCKLLKYVHLKKNTILICSMFSIAFFVNLALKTQFMFVGSPPKISFINALYNITGGILFLPVILIIIVLLQFVVLYLLRKIYHIRRMDVKERYAET